jgi:hypothetical protein
MKTALELIDEQLEVHRLEQAVDQEEIRIRTARGPFTKAKIEVLENLRATLMADESLAKDADISSDESHRTGHNGHQFAGATEAIFSYLRAAGEEGARPNVIVAGVDGTFKTAAKNPQRAVYSTIHNLVEAKRLEKTPAGRIKLPRQNT